MSNLKTKNYNFNLPIKFTAIGFTRFVDKNDLSVVANQMGTDFPQIRVYKDNLKNYFTFRIFRTTPCETVYAELVPERTNVTKINVYF